MAGPAEFVSPRPRCDDFDHFTARGCRTLVDNGEIGLLLVL
jgi:hypothetical protein